MILQNAAQVLKNNKNAQADEQAAMNCLPNATSLAGIIGCEHHAFPKGGVLKAVRCAAHQVVIHLHATAVAKRHDIAAACGSIR